MRPSDPSSILVGFPNAGLGDAIMALPLLAALRELFPAARIWCLATDDEVPVVELGGIAEGCFRLGPRYGAFPWSGWRALGESRRQGHGLTVALSHTLSRTLPAIIGSNCYRVGFDWQGRGALLDLAIPWAEVARMHLVDLYLEPARRLGWSGQIPAPVVRLPEARQIEARRLLVSLGIDRALPLVLLHLGAKWPPRRWPAPLFQELAARLWRKQGVQVLAVAGPDERLLLEHVSAGEGVFIWPEKLSLDDLIGAIAVADVVVANDSGVAHIAQALGRATVVLFGPGDEGRVGPWVPRCTMVAATAPCRPCVQYAASGTCALGEPMCMGTIAVGDVERAVTACLDLGEPVLTSSEDQR